MEWFLFSGREGFCNYYSTAAALLLRSVGIPARLVVGYAEGEHTNGANDYLVRISDSHSWVEAYFNGIGWIILEPTPSQPSISFADPTQTSEEISRQESLYLQPPESDSENLRAFSRLNEKFAVESYVTEQTNGFSRNIYLGLFIMTALGILATVVVYATIFRQSSISAPLIIEKTFKVKKKVPGWIRRWENFEQQLPAVKNYFRLRALARLVLEEDPKTLTPSELFEHLFNKINYPNPSKFSDAYQHAIYAKVTQDEIDLSADDYNKIVRLIFNQWVKRRIIYLMFRLNLGRFENLSS